MLRRPSRSRAVLALLTTAAFCVFVVGLAPHLVHHVFEHDEVQPECPFAAISEHQQGLTTAPVLLVLAETPDAPALQPADLLRAPRALAAADARAPPSTS